MEERLIMYYTNYQELKKTGSKDKEQVAYDKQTVETVGKGK